MSSLFCNNNLLITSTLTTHLHVNTSAMQSTLPYFICTFKIPILAVAKNKCTCMMRKSIDENVRMLSNCTIVIFLFIPGILLLHLCSLYLMLMHAYMCVSSPPYLSSSSVPSVDNERVRVPVVASAQDWIIFLPKDQRYIAPFCCSAAPLLCRVTIDLCDRDGHERQEREFHAETNEDECVSRLVPSATVPRFR